MTTQLLISVRSPEEARQAIAGGTDILDIKEPQHGSLGRAADDVISSILALARGMLPVSVALGELHRSPLPYPTADVQYQKVGLAHIGPAGWVAPFHELQKMIRPSLLVPVAYADADRAEGPSPFDVLPVLEQQNIRLMLIDTFIKDGRGLLHWMPTAVLRELIRRARGQGIALALAGSLAADQIGELLPLQPAILAVRGAACRGQRRLQAIDQHRVEQLARRVHGRPQSTAHHPIEPK